MAGRHTNRTLPLNYVPPSTHQTKLHEIRQQSFKMEKDIVTNFEVQIAKARLRTNLQKGMLEDHMDLFRCLSNTGAFGVGDQEYS